MPWITGGFLVVQGVQAGKHLAESKLKPFFYFCMNKCTEKAEKSSAHSGSVGHPACILLLSPVSACSCLGCAASLEPTAVSLLSKARGVFPCYFLEQKVVIVTPNVFFLVSLLKRNS